MTRLKNIKSGAIVDVPDEKVERLGPEWAAADAPEKRGPGRPRKSETDDVTEEVTRPVKS